MVGEVGGAIEQISRCLKWAKGLITGEEDKHKDTMKPRNEKVFKDIDMKWSQY